MRLFPKEIEIDDYQGFSSNDIFNRAPFGEALGNIFENIENPMVAVLDSPWGSGKTTFIKMWCGYMRNQGFPVIYFDAFKNDYADDAFTTLVGEVVELAATLKTDKKVTEELIENGEKTFLHGLWTGVKAASKHVAIKKLGEEATEVIVDLLPSSDTENDDDTDNTESAKALEKSIEKGITASESYWAEKVKKRAIEKEEIKDFCTTLTSLSALLGEAAKANAEILVKDNGQEDFGDKRRPLIFVIDELDRCRPPFALELLEKIKHLFSVEGVHFLLATHMKQLENSVRWSYGIQGQESAYLEKFYNLVLHFPNEKIHGDTPSRTYINNLFEDLADDEEDRRTVDLICKNLSSIAEKKSIQLRTLEKVTTHILLFLSSAKKSLKIGPIIVVLCLMKVVNPNLYRKAENGTLTIGEVFDFLQIVKSGSYDTGSDDWMVGWWIYCIGSEGDQSSIAAENYRSSLSQYMMRDRKDVVPYHCGRLNSMKIV